MSILWIYAEIGIGNESIRSSEIEKGDREHRIRGFMIPPIIKGVYLRIWMYKWVLVFSSRGFFALRHKDRKKFKILFGLEGVGAL